MSNFISILIVLPVLFLLVLIAWRRSDARSDNLTRARLMQHQSEAPELFESSTVRGLPDPAQRFFRFAILPGTPLRTVAAISMEGDISLGPQTAPKYMPMHAEQLLAAPFGFVWSVRMGKLMRISGSDGADEQSSWSRFWLMGILPVARVGGNSDHARAAFGRYIAEAVFWTPAALLPGDHVHWEPLDDSSARVIVSCKDMVQAVDLSVAADGSPEKIIFQRWSDANPEKEYQLQPFGGFLSDYREFEGYRLPTRLEAGNFFATDDYFPFFRARVTDIRFPDSKRRSGVQGRKGEEAADKPGNAGVY